jgi:ribosome-associated toxin RatA of RatAB toxin-antitoxin module
MEHESNATIPVAPDRVYGAIADVANLTRFVPQLRSAKRLDADHVDVEASYGGHDQHGEAWFRTDAAARRVEWGAEDHPYHGWLQVDAADDGSKVTFHLTTTHVADISDYTQRTFDSIRAMF